METLRQISERLGTNKLYHNYEKHYEKYFEPIRNKKLKILEIGIYKGNSLRLWRDYFPNAEIYGIDIVDALLFKEDRITTFKVDQSNRTELTAFINKVGKFDIIIDDGSHVMCDQQISMAVLYPQMTLLNRAGLYIVEDLHTSYFYPIHESEWLPCFKKFGVSRDFSNTTYLMIENYKKFGKISSQFMTESEQKNIEANAPVIEVYRNPDLTSCIAFIKRGPVK